MHNSLTIQDLDLVQVFAEQTDDAIFIKDLEGRYVFINQNAAALLGHASKDVIGFDDYQFFSKEQAQKIRAIDQQVITENKTIELEEPIIFRGKKVTMYTKKSPCYDQENNICGVVGIARDFDDYNNAQKLKQSEKRLQTLFEGIDDAVLVHDKAGNIIELNDAACRRLEYSRAELLNMQTSDIDTPEFAVGYQDRLTQQLQQRRWRCQGAHVTKSGKVIPVDIVCSVIEFRGDEMVLSVARDISDLKKAEQERSELESQVLHKQKLESLGLMAGGIAHDFNNLLVGVLGNAELLLNRLPKNWPERGILESVRASSEQAAQLCSQLLAYSGKGQFVIEQVDINELISELGILLKIGLSKKAVVTYELDESLPAVAGDIAQLRQVVMNLLTNSSEALLESAGTIHVNTCLMKCNREFLDACYLGRDVKPGDYIAISVEDSGMGMSSEILERIFDPFFTTKDTGHGLGLAAVLGIVRGHNGALKVESTAGLGTKITVFFPVSDKLSIDKPLTIVEQAHAHFTGTILVVDDEPMVRDVSRKMLEMLGLKVLEAVDGEQALRIFKENQESINCVLLDLTMPGLSGHETLNQLRIINPQIPIILSSGYNEQDAIQKSNDDQATDFLQKPYRLKTLQNKLQSLLGGKC